MRLHRLLGLVLLGLAVMALWNSITALHVRWPMFMCDYVGGVFPNDHICYYTKLTLLNPDWPRVGWNASSALLMLIAWVLSLHTDTNRPNDLQRSRERVIY